MEPMSLLTVIGLITSLVFKLSGAIIDAVQAGKKVDADFQIDKKLILDIVDQTVLSMRDKLKEENRSVEDMDDKIDREMRKK